MNHYRSLRRKLQKVEGAYEIPPLLITANILVYYKLLTIDENIRLTGLALDMVNKLGGKNVKEKSKDK